MRNRKALVFKLFLLTTLVFSEDPLNAKLDEFTDNQLALVDHVADLTAESFSQKKQLKELINLLAFISPLEGRVQNLTLEIQCQRADFKTFLMSSKMDAEESKVAIDENRQQISELKIALNDKDVEIKALKKRNRKEVKDMKESIKTKDFEISGLKTELNSSKREIQGLKKSIAMNNKDAEINDLKADLEMQRKQVQELRDSLRLMVGGYTNLIVDGPFGGLGGWDWSHVSMFKYGTLNGIEISYNADYICSIRASYGVARAWSDVHGHECSEGNAKVEFSFSDKITGIVGENVGSYSGLIAMKIDSNNETSGTNMGAFHFSQDQWDWRAKAPSSDCKLAFLSNHFM